MSGPSLTPAPVRLGTHGMVCAIDHLAAQAGVQMLQQGGTAADAAVATSAVLAVTSQHACGMGGDLWALVHPGATATPVALNASGRAGSGADAQRLRDRGLGVMPDGGISVVTVPGCVDGWAALSERFGRLGLAAALEPARAYAQDGFPASPGLADAVATVADLPEAVEFRGVRTGTIVRRPGVAQALAAVADGGRDAFYRGEFAARLIELADGEFSEPDVARAHADWVAPLTVDAWGQRLWTAPPNSQGYLTLAAAAIAEGLALGDPDDPRWAHLLIEAARQAAHDRLDVLHDHADGAALLAPERLAARRAAIDPRHAAALPVPAAAGDTVAVCAVDERGQAVSLLQSNAAGWGSGLIVPGLRIFLHNRGRGFSLEAGHPAEYGPGRRPPHTLSPTLVTGSNGELRAAVATMGGDSQPQVLLQLLARLLAGGQEPGEAMQAGRFALAPPLDPADEIPDDGFSTWRAGGRVSVALEGQVAPGWAEGLRARGHCVRSRPPFASEFGHAAVIDARAGVLWGAGDPRARAGAACGW